MDSFSVSHEEYSVFHAMDKSLYSVLAVELWRNPHEAILIMALWLWFERLGFKNIVQNILSLPRIIINELADEAIVCYRCIKDPQFLYSAKATDIPLTYSILKKKFSLEYFQKNRDTVIDGIRSVVHEVCFTALADVIGEAIKRHSAQKPAKKQNNVSSAFEQSLDPSLANLGFICEFPQDNSNGERVSPTPEESLVENFANMSFAGETTHCRTQGNRVPLASEQSFGHGFANMGLGGAVPNGSTPANMVPPAVQLPLGHIYAKMGLKGRMNGGVAGAVPPRLARSLGHSFGNLGLTGEISDGPSRGSPSSRVCEQSLGNSFAELGFGAEMPNGIIPGNGSPPENRTLFVTFSKGYPVTELEVREFFTQLFGDCIEAFYMQPVMPHEQPLYARVVFCKPDIIDMVLNGLQKAKYTINGKHLWMRKFIAKRAGCSSSSSSYSLHP